MRQAKHSRMVHPCLPHRREGLIPGRVMYVFEGTAAFPVRLVWHLVCAS